MPHLEAIGYDKEKHDRALRGLSIERVMAIKDLVAPLAEMYHSLYGVDAIEINDGLCEAFAHDLKALLATHLPEFAAKAKVRWIDEIDNLEAHGVAHAVLVCEGRYYDSECSEGVDLVSKLPVVDRVYQAEIAAQDRKSGLI